MDIEIEEKRLEKLLKEALETGDYDIYLIEPEKVRFVKVPEKATFVRGHYRTVNGKRVYVRPHYRNKPNPSRRKK
ncbi:MULTISPECIES: hypothetical protein [unclassified Archaeoglobus]|jgi:hypothetical protein|uniref:hypothetical protein n=1 Tax=unclassified Archaeoglobus TaxID=2643606 RepID=UPI0025BB27CC|nr:MULTISPECIES: hypothetical protein [unclassified Archaeoglobus]